ncbi:uncharacterized protein [Periplaneta americana]|uniref:uncharacterized protein n=1 Tax=Periplaneta americana TaxID=6978 RepID=UPI0037E932CF
MRVQVLWFKFSQICMKEMPYYAVAKGKNPGIYKTWPECQAQVNSYSGAKYRKFDTEEAAIEFIRNHQNKALAKESLQKHVKQYEDKVFIPLGASPKARIDLTSTQITKTMNPSSPILKIGSLKQRLELLEKKFDLSMTEIRLEIDTLKDKIGIFSDKATSSDSSETKVTEDFKSLREDLSNLAKLYTNSVSVLTCEINNLKEAVKSLGNEREQNKVEVPAEARTTNNALSFKRNLTSLLEAVPVSTTTERSYSTSSNENRAKKRKLNDAKGTDSQNLVNVTNSYEEKFSPGFTVDKDGYVEVYTDGACEQNGRVGAKAGIGVWFGDNHPLNYSERVRGRLTNNTAEIQAATCAVDLAKRAGIAKLLIHTDSQFLISCITVWIHKWKTNDWKLKDGGPVKNKEDLIALDQALEGISVRWNHVRGHRGNHGNEMADALARAGAKKRY